MAVTKCFFSFRLTNGLFNTLFYFTILTNFSGVFVCPNSAKVVDKLSAEILRHYTSSCKQIHEWFQSKQVRIISLLICFKKFMKIE